MNTFPRISFPKNSLTFEQYPLFYVRAGNPRRRHTGEHISRWSGAQRTRSRRLSRNHLCGWHSHTRSHVELTMHNQPLAQMKSHALDGLWILLFFINVIIQQITKSRKVQLKLKCHYHSMHMEIEIEKKVRSWNFKCKSKPRFYKYKKTRRL